MHEDGLKVLFQAKKERNSTYAGLRSLRESFISILDTLLLCSGKKLISNYMTFQSK
jgi:hypothetical protein